ncbi:glmz -inactivating ntpase [Lasius niger]|uniref:Glmz-inactivating ntpase n=1 Tax=Lasius niger TaxID=67767 RepID=A0A0J7KID9_LASNI|nr:glmz -inactivating ntpase [Lasius niger]
MLEDLGYEVVDNPPLEILEALAEHSSPLRAIGIDVRSYGFKAEALLKKLQKLREKNNLPIKLLYTTADEEVLMKRFTATRRRHPLSMHYEAGHQGEHTSLREGIAKEIALLEPICQAADDVLDTSDLTLPALRQLVQNRFSGNKDYKMGVTVTSFAFPHGLPREADMIFDARFLKNPYYVEALREKTGQDPEVVAHIAEDEDYGRFYQAILKMVELVLPRFAKEGKKYVTIGIGCSGGRHRSVALTEKLGHDLQALIAQGLPREQDFSLTIAHRELKKQQKL